MYNMICSYGYEARHKWTCISTQRVRMKKYVYILLLHPIYEGTGVSFCCFEARGSQLV